MDAKEIADKIQRQLSRFDVDTRSRIIDELFVPPDRRTCHLANVHITADIAQAAKDQWEWLKNLQTRLPNREISLERNDQSRLHVFREAVRSKLVLNRDSIPSPPSTLEDGSLHTFVVKHDWARAFNGADDIDGEIRLPYESCAFEFRMHGKNIIALAHDFVLDTKEIDYEVYVQSNECWFGHARKSEYGYTDPIVEAVWNQIRAICIALEASVATHSVIRAPHKLNEKRIRNGKIPLSDYHIVDLARRQKIENVQSGMNEGTKQRMHFRRGHWRHFDGFKTWVRWYLAGDPDLGFIHKEYAL